MGCAGQRRMIDRPSSNLTTTQRGYLETALQAMEAGRFQELLLQFLPAFDLRFIGITRYGGTAFGKTRPGVPDLIKTLSSGEEIACECGTEEGYWSSPEDEADYEKWKPVADALECIARLSKPVEIVLASNREIPRGHPSAKSQLIAYLRQKTAILITPLSSEDIAGWFQMNATSPVGKNLLQQFFSELFESIRASYRNEVLESTFRQSELAGFPVDTIQRIVGNNLGLNEKDIAGLVQEQLGFDSGKFRLSPPGEFRGVSRAGSSPESLRDVIGRVIQLNGIPKIGKTWLCYEMLSGAGRESYYYLCPTNETLLPDFADALLVDLFSEYWSRSEVVAAKRKNRLLQLPAEAARQLAEQKVFVVENAHLLRRSELNMLAEGIRWLKTATQMRSVGIVMLTNKPIAQQFPVVDESFVAPAWTSGQLLKLLGQHGITPPGHDPDKYGELLRSMSGGHPLNALALARKYPTGSALATALLGAPSPADPDLSNELKVVLYQDILTTADKQNLVQRLSLLTNRANGRVLEWLRLKVQPNITTSVDILFEEIGGAVLDGDPKSGLAVSSTFKSIAGQRMSKEEQRAVYRMLAQELFRPVGKVFDGASLIESVWYSMLAGDFEKAFAGASFALFGLIKKDQDPAIVRGVFSRLEFIEWITVPAEPVAKLYYCAYFAMASHCASRAKDQQRASTFLEKVDLDWLQTCDFSDKEQAEMASSLYIAVLGQRLLLLSNDREPRKVLSKYFDSISFPKSPHTLLALLEVVPLIITHLSDVNLLQLDWNVLVKSLASRDVGQVANLALFIGNLINEKSALQRLLDVPENHEPIVVFYRKLVRASAEFHANNHQKALHHLNVAATVAKNKNLSDKELGAAYFQFVGDVHFEVKGEATSIDAYEHSNALTGRDEQHIVAWNELRIGILREGVPDVSARHINKAISLFDQQHNYKWVGRAIAILSVIMLKAKCYSDALEAGQRLARLYHTEHRSEVGGSLRMLAAQILRLSAELSGKSLPEPVANFHSLDTRIHFRTFHDSLKPEAGGAVTFNVLAQLAQIVGLREVAIGLLRSSLQFEVVAPLDINTQRWNIHQLLTLLEPPEIDWTELESLVWVVLAQQPDPDDTFAKGFFDILLQPLRAKAQQEPAKWAAVFAKYLELIERLVPKLPGAQVSRWAPRLIFSKGIVSLALAQKQQATEYFREALEMSKKTDPAFAFDAAAKLAFDLYSTSDSIRDLAKRQYDALTILFAAGGSDEQILNFGINLFRACSVLTWRRLAASDLTANTILFDGARILKTAGFREEDAAPVVTALLLRVFNDEAALNIKFPRERLPEELKTYFPVVE